jgi:hypothetical protein
MKIKELFKTVWFPPLLLFIATILYARSIDSLAAIGIFIMGLFISVGLLLTLYLHHKKQKSWILSIIGGILFVICMIFLIRWGVI